MQGAEFPLLWLMFLLNLLGLYTEHRYAQKPPHLMKSCPLSACSDSFSALAVCHFSAIIICRFLRLLFDALLQMLAI